MVRLKQLSLADAGPINAATLPGIERLTALEDLSLSEESHLTPSCLLPIATGLTSLELAHLSLRPDQAQQGDASGSSQLLQLLPQLTALRRLELDTVACQWPQQLAAYSSLTASSNLQQLAAYSSLTASSNLQQLSIKTCMQDAVWAHVFPAGLKLPHLRGFVSLHGDDFDFRELQSCALSPDTLARLGSCCPGLQNLSFIPLCGGAGEAASFAPLRCLTALERLCVYYMDPTTYSSLAALTQLKDLMLAVPIAGDGDDLVGAAADCVHHLVPLTALTGLTALKIRQDPAIEPWALTWRNRAPEGSPPDVSVQLLEHCTTLPKAQPAVLSSMLRQLQQQQQQGAQQVAQLQRQQKQANQQAAQLQQQQDDIAELRQQHTQELAASTAEAAELRGRVQGLEGQLQEVLAALRPQPRHG